MSQPRVPLAVAAILAPIQANVPPELRLVVLGDAGVGTTSLVVQFVTNHFPLHYDPTLEVGYRKQISVGGERVVLDIMDIVGRQEDGRGVLQHYIRAADGLLLVYAVSSRPSLEALDAYYQLILDTKQQPSFPVVVVVGNKSDLEDDREVKTSDGQAFAKRLGVPFIETSAKLRTNVDEAFDQLVGEIRRYREERERGVERLDKEDHDGHCGKGGLCNCVVA